MAALYYSLVVRFSYLEGVLLALLGRLLLGGAGLVLVSFCVGVRVCCCIVCVCVLYFVCADA